MYLKELIKRQTFPLHIHWDGSIPAEHLFNLAKMHGRELLLPEKDIYGNKIKYKSHDERVIHNVKELEQFMHNLRKYNLVDVFGVPVSFMQTREDLISNAIAHCHYLKSQNSPYAETRFAPQYHGFEGLSMEQVICYAVEGFEKGKEETGVDVRLIISIGREVKAEAGVKVAEAAVACNKMFPKHVLGIDLACEEKGNPPEKHYPAFELTFDTPLRRTVHAGEMCSEKVNLRNIKTSIYKLRADGLGHASPLHKSPSLTEAVLERGIRIESNPVCNNFFFNRRIHEDLRLDKLVDAGVLVTINPDDPAMIPNGHMVDNLEVMAKLYGMEFIDKVIDNSIKTAWGLTDEEKDMFLAQAKV